MKTRHKLEPRNLLDARARHRPVAPTFGVLLNGSPSEPCYG